MTETSPLVKPARHNHTVRRLETFSDIVIAFTLSQLAFTLRLPHSSRDLMTHPLGQIAFLGSFTFVCGLWWLHHRLFGRYFYPDTASVLANFLFLASTVYFAYSMLLVTTFGDAIALSAYGLSVGCAYALLALLLAKGSHDSRLQLEQEDRAEGRRVASRVAIAAVAFFSSSLLAILGRSQGEIAAVWITAGVLIALLALSQRLARRRREQKASSSA